MGFPTQITPVTPFINPYWVNGVGGLGDYLCYPGTPNLFGICDYTTGEICCNPTAPNPYPNTPTLSCTSIGLANNNYAFSFTGTDNENLRYGVNWNGGNTVEEWFPASGYVASGTTVNAQHSWTTVGAKTIKVMSQSQSGQYSALWANCPINIVANLSVDAGGPYTHTIGTPTTLTATRAGGGTITSWNWAITNNAGNCTLTNQNTATPTISCSNIYTDTTLSVTVTDSLGETASDTATVRTIPVPTCRVIQINPNPRRVSGNSTITVDFNDFQADPSLAGVDSVSCGNATTAPLTCVNQNTLPYSGLCTAQCAYTVSAVQSLSVGATIASSSQTKACTARAINLNPNLAPSAPTVVRTTPGTASVNSMQSFDFNSVDPEGDLIKYQVDWNNDGISDENVPLNYIPSATIGTGTYTWTTAGAKTFRVRAEDNFTHLKSAWTAFTLTLVLGPACTVLPAGTITSAYDSNIDFNVTASYFAGAPVASSNINSKCYSLTTIDAEFRNTTPVGTTFLMRCPYHKNDGNISVLITGNVAGESAVCSSNIRINLSANAGPDKSIATRYNEVLNGSALGGRGIYTYNWVITKDVNTTNPKCTLTNATTLTPTFRCDIDAAMSGPKTATVRFTVNDGRTFANDDVNIVVTYPTIAPFSISAGPDAAGFVDQNISLIGIINGGLAPFVINWSFVTPSPSPTSTCAIFDSTTLTPKVYCLGIDANGIKALRLTVNDDAYQVRSDDVLVNVSDMICPELDMNCLATGITYPNLYQTSYPCSTNGILKACFKKGYPPVSSDVNSIVSLDAKIVDGNVVVTLVCTKYAKSTMKFENFSEAIPVQLLVSSPANSKVDCNVNPITSTLIPLVPFVDGTVIRVTANIKPDAPNCTVCEKVEFINYNQETPTKSVPDNGIIVIIAALAIVVGLLSKRRN